MLLKFPSIFSLATIFTLTPCSVFANIWHNAFIDADLYFIFTPEYFNSVVDFENEFPYFHPVIANNAYTPLRLELLYHTMYKIKHPQENYNNLENSSRYKCIFVSLESTKGEEQKCENLLNLAGISLRQEYIYGYLNSQNDECRELAAINIGSARLVIFQFSLPSHILVPCLTCDTSAPNIIPINTISHRDIQKSWDLQNRNMHKFAVLGYVSVNSTCSIFINGFVNFKYVNTNICPMAAIGHKYNLTGLKYGVGEKLLENFKNRNFGLVATSGTNELNLFTYSIHQVSYTYINFVTITNPPSASVGVETFSSPFDTGTWACLLVSILTILVFLMYLDANQINAVDFLPVLAGKLIVILSILLGQVDESMGKAYRTGKAAFVIIILWLLLDKMI